MGKKDAIQEEVEETILDEEDVVEETSEDAKDEPVLFERDRVIAELAKKRKEEIKGQQQKDENDDDESDESDDEIVDLKVDGEIVQMPKKEVDSMGGLSEAQKHLSAEKRLHQASIERKKIEQANIEYRQREQALKQREEELEKRLRSLEVKNKEPEVNEDEIVNRFVQSVYSGDEDEAKESLRDILKKMKSPVPKETPQFNEKDLLNKALFEVEKRNGQREFSEKFAHLKNDPFLFEKTNHRTAELLSQHPDWSPRDIIIEAAQEVDQWYKDKIGDKGVDTLQERKASKQKIEPIQSAQTRKKQEPEYKKKTKDDIIEMYRKSRAR